MATLEQTLTYRLHLLHKLTDVASQRAYVQGTGLSMGVGRCLTAVGSFAPLSVNDLANKTNLTKGQASRAAQSLVEQGLVRKIASPNDGRGVVLTLTRNGQAAWSSAMQVIERRNQEIFGLLSESEQAQLSAMIDRLLAQARTPRSVAAPLAASDE
ncbi:MAG: transcriptional regulator, MarR family [Polaromonas sp.]|nr:transcriptional regulator, MarR family [Polaromonas sp.]